jgi:subtilisin family serine protease
MLELKTLLADSPFLLYLQPDLLPLRKSVQRPPFWNSPQEFNERSFQLADYLPLQQLWQKTKGKGFKIAVIDSGINPNHPALQHMSIKFNWDGDENLPINAPEQDDLHGTWVAGIIWARPELVTPIPALTPGVAWGIAPEAELIALKLRRPWTSNLLRVFALAEQQQADVINISWLLPWVAAPVREYLEYLTSHANHEKGIVIVAAADPQYQPNLGLAAMKELLVVSSTDHRGQLANSSWDTNVDIAAATYLLSVSFRPPMLYERFAKTSATAPLVSGLIALFRATRPDLTASQLELLLTDSAATAEARLPDGQLIRYKNLDANKAYKQLLIERLQQ